MRMIRQDLPTSVVIVGNPTRHVAQSAYTAGYRVGVIDTYKDRDLMELAEHHLGTGELAEDVKIGAELVDDGVYDCMVMSGGIEKHELPKAIFHNPLCYVSQVNLASDKKKLAKILDSLSIPNPHLMKEPEEFPLVVKPRYGSGGDMVAVVHSEEELENVLGYYEQLGREYILQQYVSGHDLSVSVISNSSGGDLPLCLNEQLLGEHLLHAPPFRYCGNITPSRISSIDLLPGLREAIKKLSRKFLLLGSWGIDIVVGSREWWLIEVNPRFQGSIDTIDASMGISIFDLHVKAFHGYIPNSVPSPLGVWARGVYYAPRDVMVDVQPFEQLWEDGKLRDVPPVGEQYVRGTPLVSIVVNGTFRQNLMQRLSEVAEKLDTVF